MSETFGQALRRIRLARGLSQAQAGGLVGYTGGYISDLERGRRIAHPDTARAIDGKLGANGLLVALARSPAAGPAALLPDWDSRARLAAGMSGRIRPDQAMADRLVRSLAVHRSAEDLAGPKRILTPVLRELTAVEALRAAAVGSPHRALLSLEAQYAQFLGWIYQDLGNVGASEQWYARALMIAHEAGDENMIASILSMRSNSAGGRGDVQRAVDLGEAATRPRATPGVLSFSHQQVARGYAAAGEADAADRALGIAFELSQQAADDPGREPPWIYFLDEARAELHRAAALRALGRSREAVELFRHALGHLPAEFRRDRGQNLARLAGALAAAGERDEAGAVAAEARLLAQETGSDRALREVGRAERAIAA